jgi:DNA-binding protein Alba
MGETVSTMFPVLAIVLIIGSVILMILWEFRPQIDEYIIPFFVDLLSVSEEKQTQSPIYLASSQLESELRLLLKRAKKIAWLGIPEMESGSLKPLLNKMDGSALLRMILAKQTSIENVKEMANKLNLSVEIINRPRIHFNALVTEKNVAVCSTAFPLKVKNPVHELTLIASDSKIVKEAQQYYAAFFEGASEYPKDDQIYSPSSELPRKSKSAFVNTSNGLNDLMYGLLSSAKNSVILVSPFITNGVAEFLLNVIPREVQVKFITQVDWRNWIEERSDPEALEMLLSDRVVIDVCPNLEANCIVVDNQAAIISSQNLTTQSCFYRDEAGIFTRSKSLIDAVIQRIESWKPKHRFTMELLEQEISNFDSFLKKEITPPPMIPEQKEDEQVTSDDGEPLAPPLLGFSALTQAEEEGTTVPAQLEPLLPATLPDEPAWLEDIVYVGKKRTVEYVRACQHQLKRKGSVTIRARGRLIYRAVDVAEQLRLLTERKLILSKDSIKIETYYPTGKETKWGGISQIAITLHQKN